MKNPELRAHQQWLGYLQPVGLVVSPPALLQAGAYLNRDVLAEHQRFLEYVEEGAVIRDLLGLLLDVFGWQRGDLVDAGDPRAAALEVVLPEYHETLRPTYAVPEHQRAEKPNWLMLIQVLPTGTPLDEIAASDNHHWQATPQARFERLLRETRVAIGLLGNGTHLRLVYAPRGESTGHLTFPVQAMVEAAGRPILSALLLLLSAERLFALPDKQRLPAILADSRKYQNTVSNELAQQVLAALYELLRGFQAADAQRKGDLLRDVLSRDPDQIYAGLLTVLLRLVFLLYAEDRGLMSDDEVYTKNYSVAGLFERLQADAGRYPDTMDLRYGAWAQLLALFRMVHRGARHGRLHLPKRSGYLFDPDRYPFLEGGGVAIPLVADGVLFRVLQNLLVLDGERISYRSLDVEQIGSVYETMMGFRLEKATGRSIAIKPAKAHGAPVTIDLDAVLRVPAKDRGKWLKERTDQNVTGAALNALKSADTPEALAAALERKIARELTPNIVPPGSLVLQPNDERRRSGSHYTPRSLTEPIVRKALGIGSREWGVGSGEGGEIERKTHDDKLVSRSQSLASGHGAGQGQLSADAQFPESRNVRTHQSDSASGGLDSGQYRGGQWTGEHGGLHSVSPDSPGQSQGTGDPSDSGSRSRNLPRTSDTAPTGSGGSDRPHAPRLDSQSSGKAPTITHNTLPPTPHSLFPTPHSLFPTPQQILALKICDPAMGSGAFLVEACRQLGDALLKAWNVHGGMPKVPDDETPELFAQRSIAQRCLYGVDKNPMAVDLAKMSLWLATLAKDHAFTFLDHALRCGDSLVGLTRDQIVRFHWKEGQQQQPLDAAFLLQRLQSATRVRQEILEAGDEVAFELKQQKLALADESLNLMRFAGNLVVAAFFAGDNERERQSKRDELLAQLTEYISNGDMNLRPTAAEKALRSGEKGITPFHWEIEFPEVFAEPVTDEPRPRGSGARGFDCIVGNPPFMGGTKISTASGEAYLAWLLNIHPESHGNADLVAHFFRRAFNLLRPGGTFGLIATNTIAQGDTRTTGLRCICTQGGTIYNALRRMKWPGQAAVVVSVVHIIRGVGSREWGVEGLSLTSTPHSPLPTPFLDDKPVPRITAYLFHAGGHDNPATLKANVNKSFTGAKIYGQGFTFDDTDKDGVASPLAEMQRLIAKDARNAERIFPYIGGEEVNDSPTHAHHRYVINFGEMTEEQARQWPDLMAIVEAKVKPERAHLKRNAIGRKRAANWWIYGSTAKELYAAIRGLERVLVIPRVTQHAGFVFLPAGTVYSEQLVVFALPSFAAFCTLQSRVHEIWARFFGSSLEDRLRYTPSDCFETFPFPEGVLSPLPDGRGSALESVGKEYYEFRAALMVRNNEGLTKTYNRFHDPNERSSDILRLRELHAAMDRAVLDAYGWTDLQPTCEFLLDYSEEGIGSGESGVGEGGMATPDSPLPIPSRKRKPWRYRWPDAFHDEVLARLLELNKQRAEQEALAGAVAVKKQKQLAKRGRQKKGDEQNRDLFHE